MTLPEGFPLTAAVSPRVQWIGSTDSTNADVVAAVQAGPDLWPHLSLLLTSDQRAGRGRLDRTWTTPPGAALAVSVVLDVSGLPLAARGWVPLIAGAAMTAAIRGAAQGTGHDVESKWPNDVILDGGKVCGILAEVVPGQVDRIVVGSGINTRIAQVDLPVETATSFLAVGLEVQGDRLLADYLTGLDRLLRALIGAGGDADESGVRSEVEARCGTLGREVRVSLPDGGELRGRAERLDADGRIVVTGPDGESAVGAGDVIHLRA